MTSTTAPHWSTNSGPSDSGVNVFFDYSTAGIPAAPGGGGTRGLKLQANQANAIFSGVSVSPTNSALPAEYTLKFDWWSNFNGPFPAGGSGSTQLSTFGVGTAGTAAQWPGGITDSVWFAATGEGNSASDWRTYSSAATSSYPDASPIYAAGAVTGNRNSSSAYYSTFGSVTAPAAQLTSYSQQTGTTGVGSAGMEWHQVEITKSTTAITWFVDCLLIATVDASTVTLGGNNIFFGHSDTNTTTSVDVNDVNLLFTLIDNVQVIPEPASAGLLTLGSLALLGRRRRTC